MKKITITTLLILGICPVFADEISDARMEWARKHFAKQGSPVPDGGVQIVPENKMSQYKLFKYERQRNKRDIAQYGYIKKEASETKTLFNIKQEAAKDYAKHGLNFKDR